MGEVPAREVLWNITGHWLIYPCFIAALAVAAAVTYLWERPMNRRLTRLCEKRRRLGSK